MYVVSKANTIIGIFSDRDFAMKISEYIDGNVSDNLNCEDYKLTEFNSWIKQYYNQGAK